jgi:two-component system sensor histidine kinase KdpD
VKSLRKNPSGNKQEHQLPRIMLSHSRRSNRLQGYMWGIAAPFICTLIDWPLRHVVGPASILMTYLLGVFLVASRYGHGASIIASFLSAPVFAFYFAQPIFSFAISDLENIIGLGVMMVVANVTSNFLEKVQLQAEISKQRENRANALYRLSQALSDAHNQQSVAKIAVSHIHDDFGALSALLFPDRESHLCYPSGMPLEHSLRDINLKIAQQAYQQRSVKQTSETVYYPLEHSQAIQGILAIKPPAGADLANPELTTFFDTFLNLISQTLERLSLTEQANNANLQAETESLRNALLSAISHDLRTPLTRIIGAGTALVENNADFSAEEKLDFNKVILDEAQRMSELTSKILDMARLTAGEIILHQEWNALEEIVGSALNRLERNLGTRPIRTLLPDNLPLLWVDAVLIEQVLANLIENAIKYTAEGSPIDISAELSANSITITVSDYGFGIPQGMEEKIFDKFYRLESESHQGGVGLGLTLCRAIIEAHGGTIHATNQYGKGASFIIILPIHESPELNCFEGMSE